MLDTICGGCRELGAVPPAATPKSSTAAAALAAAAADGAEGEAAARRRAIQETIERRLAAKTRRFASASRPPPAGQENRFAEFVGEVFYPLARLVDRAPRVVAPDQRGDALLLGRLLHTLAVVLAAAGGSHRTPQLGASLLELAMVYRHHEDPHVRRSVLLAAATVLQTVPPALVAAELGAEVHELRAWLPATYREDPDAQCRDLALAGLMAIAKVAEALQG